MDTIQGIAELAMCHAAGSATLYINTHNLQADPVALAECLTFWVRAKLPEALHDSSEAIAAGMGAYAERTFLASMALAGIEAAKEAGFPRTGVRA